MDQKEVLSWIRKARDENGDGLDLSRNNIAALPPEIGELKNLSVLDLSETGLTALPPEIGLLANLKILMARKNKLSELPKEIGQLGSLMTLDLSTNQLSALPAEINQLIHLTSLDLRGNPLPIPPEILDKIDKPQTILNYYFSKQKKPLNETKLIVVGQGSVGKTSLIERMLRDTFDPQQNKTEGISISQWMVTDQQAATGIPASIRLNLWDFGGQEIMHATHQFFLTKRSLYLLVLDARLTQEENRVEYWLKMIQSFGGESPVLIVGNKTDQHPLDLDRTGLQKKYPNIVGILKTSAATGAGIEALKAAITEQANALPHVRDLLPETWFTIKTRLEGLGCEANFINREDYDQLCNANEVRDETSQKTLIGFLHDLGVVLYFQDDPRLEALGILNPQWVTNGVYKILNSPELFQKKGLLDLATLDKILNLTEYPRGKRLFIVDMMKKFELCFDLEPDKTFLVPDLLPKDEPELDFKGVPAFAYQYPVLPSSVMTRFIVRMNGHIDDGLLWRSGVVLKIGENTALVKADTEDKTISIAIDGQEYTRRDALAAIRYQLDEIHASISGLNPQKRVPIPNAPNAEALDYDYLLQLERDSELEVLPVKNGSRLVKVNIRQLLSGIEREAQSRENAARITNIYVGGDVGGSLVAGDQNDVSGK